MVGRILEVLNLKSNQFFSVEGEKQFSYYQLEDCVNRMTNLIYENKWNKIVLCMKQGFWGYATVISSYLAGSTFCIINSELPRLRVEAMIAEFQPDVVITSERGGWVEDYPHFRLDEETLENVIRGNKIYVNNKPNKYAYVMFTSGTTGKPKGCKIIRKAVAKVCDFALNKFPISDGMVYGQYVPLHFDMSLIDVFCGVIKSVTLIVFDTIAKKLRPANLIRKYKIAFLNVTPQFVEILIRSEGLNYEFLSSLRAIRFGGDKIYKAKAALLFSVLPNIEIFSTYGTTETTLFCMCQKIRKDTLEIYSRELLTIGEPISGWDFYLSDMDENGIGEIVIFGSYIGDGYLGNSNGGFRKVIVNGVLQRAYFTGDYAKREDGKLFFEGRRDCQVKFNGQRGSLNEVENAMIEMGIDEVAVIFKDNVICCYYVNSKKISIYELQTGMKQRLPLYMIPSKMVEIEDMPYTFNGKIDRMKLKKLGGDDKNELYHKR